LCVEIPLSEGVEQPKISPKPPGKALSDVILLARLQNFAADAAKKETRSAHFFETALRAVLFDVLIRINSGPKILRKVFFIASMSTRLRGEM